MNKIVNIGGAVALLALVVIGVAVAAGIPAVFAQDDGVPSSMDGSAAQGGSAAQSGSATLSAAQPEPIFGREAAKAAAAEVLGLPVEELEAALAEGRSLAELARQQGVSLEVVHEAVQAARAAAIEQALAQGTITQEEADRLLGRPWPRPRRAARWLNNQIFGREEMHAAAAEALGLTAGELAADRAEGRSIFDLAQEQGVNLADLWAAVEAARTEAIEQAVVAGTISRTHADWLLNHPWPGQFLAQRALGREIWPPEARRATLAGALDLTVEELEAARAEGRTLVELAEAQGIDLVEVRQAMAQAWAAAVQEAFEEGLITAEQAERLIDHPGYGWGGRKGPGPVKGGSRSAPTPDPFWAGDDVGVILRDCPPVP